LCATTTENWIAFVVEFLEQLSRDRPALERQFGGAAVSGPVSSVEVGLSDAHDGGKVTVRPPTSYGRRCREAVSHA
jgi:lantibiotic modifying enzyme